MFGLLLDNTQSFVGSTCGVFVATTSRNLMCIFVIERNDDEKEICSINVVGHGGRSRSG
jgi:hypothetical protein